MNRLERTNGVRVTLALLLLFLQMTGRAQQTASIPQNVYQNNETAGWAVGGGEVKGDAVNPWFIQNTAALYYCIESAPEFEAGENGERRQLEWLVAQAFDYWKKEFVVDQRALDIKVGTQLLVYHPRCNDLTDVRFQFGFLSDDQLSTLVGKGINVRKNVALSVRTEYSTINMKAKGFVYLAPRAGELRPEGRYSPPWNTSIDAIYKTLVHEIGHIYGVPHSSDLLDVMFEGQGESLVQNDPETTRTGGIRMPLSKFGFREALDSIVAYTVCQMTKETREFYGLSSNAKGVSWRTQGLDTLLVQEDSCSDSADHDLRTIGRITIDRTGVSFRANFSGIRAWLPADQTVLPRREGDTQLRHGLLPMTRTFRATYNSDSGKVTRSLLLELEPSRNTFNLYSFLDGKTVFGPGLFLAGLPGVQ